jgi:hypothetical protein
MIIQREGTPIPSRLHKGLTVIAAVRVMPEKVTQHGNP